MIALFHESVLKHAALKRTIKDVLARNQDNASQWGDMFIRGQLFQ
jgi:hypothetical protein